MESLMKKNLAYPYQYFKSRENYKLPDNSLKKDSSRLKNGYPDGEEIERTLKVFEIFFTRDGEKSTQLFFEKLPNVVNSHIWNFHWSV